MATVVSIFPSVANGVASSRQLSEQNITSLIKYITDTNGGTFVISESVSDTDGISFDFMIDGYYFSISDSGNDMQSIFDSLSNSGNSLYAYIHIDGSPFKELDVASPFNAYKGVAFSTSAPNGSYKSLLLAQKSDGSWSVPLGSRKKYNGSRIYGVIDGNELST